MKTDINKLIIARQHHLDAAHPIKDLPVMAKFYNHHVKEAKRIQQEIQGLLCDERIKKAEAVAVKHVGVAPTNRQGPTLAAKTTQDTGYDIKTS